MEGFQADLTRLDIFEYKRVTSSNYDQSIDLLAGMIVQKSKTVGETSATSFVVLPFIPAAATLVSFLVGCFSSTWDMFLRFLLVSWYIVLIVLLPLFLQFINHHI